MDAKFFTSLKHLSRKLQNYYETTVQMNCHCTAMLNNISAATPQLPVLGTKLKLDYLKAEVMQNLQNNAT